MGALQKAVAPEDVAMLQTTANRLRKRAIALRLTRDAVAGLVSSTSSSHGPTLDVISAADRAQEQLSASHMSQPSAQAIGRVLRHVIRVSREHHSEKWSAVKDAASHYAHARSESVGVVADVDLSASDAVVNSAERKAAAKLDEQAAATQKAAELRARKDR